MGLSKQKVEQELRDKKLTCLNLDEYKNLNTTLTVKCEKGHLIETNLKTIRNPNFKCSICEGQNSINNDSINLNSPPNKNNAKRIVAIDNATENVGISVFDNGKLVFWCDYHYNGETLDRILKNYVFLTNTVIKKWEPDFLIFEDIQYQNNILTFKTLAMLLGVSLIAAKEYNINYKTVLSKTWRSHFIFNGKTRIQQKQEAINIVQKMYNIQVNNDIADAILLGKYAVDCLQNEKKKLF